MTDWFLAPGSALVAVFLSTLGVYAVVIFYIRLVGLRSLSKMTSFDFVMTIAAGAVVASTLLTQSVPLLQGAVALATLFAVQVALALLRQHADWAGKLIDNEPVVLMAGGRMLHDTLRRTRVTENDVWAKLREANVLDPAHVRAVVLETTGDISVLHGDPDGPGLHPCILRGVSDESRLTLDKEDDYEG